MCRQYTLLTDRLFTPDIAVQALQWQRGVFVANSPACLRLAVCAQSFRILMPLSRSRMRTQPHAITQAFALLHATRWLCLLFYSSSDWWSTNSLLFFSRSSSAFPPQQEPHLPVSDDMAYHTMLVSRGCCNQAVCVFSVAKCMHGLYCSTSKLVLSLHSHMTATRTRRPTRTASRSLSLSGTTLWGG